jgi:hypothetical protein
MQAHLRQGNEISLVVVSALSPPQGESVKLCGVIILFGSGGADFPNLLYVCV